VKVCPVCSREYPDEIRFCQDDGTTLRAAAPTTSLVGQVIADRYHVTKKLGEGGMGQVYLAEHVKMGRESAIKVMSPSMMHDPDSVARFKREAANASRISHPNVCAVYDFGETPDGLIYLAMEYVKGEALTDLLAREGALPVVRASAIFRQTADALQAAHDLGIVHRDLKPDNIMIARGRDGSDQVKVVDFGIAKAVGGDETGQKVTKTGLVVGTPEFMSPEQLSGDRVDGRSDLYSLALVYFRMLTGHLPFQADTVQETMIKRLTDEPAKLSTTRPDLSFPAGLQSVLDTALVRTPGERYQSVAKFAEDVTGAVQLRAPTRGAATPATRAQAELEDRTQMIDSKETRARASVHRPDKKRSLIPIMAVGVIVLGAAGGGYILFAGSRGGAGGQAQADSNHVASPESTKLAVVPPPDTTKFTSQTSGQTGGQIGTQTTHPRETTTTPPPRPTIDVARADALLNDLFDKLDGKTISAGTARDSAEHIYNAQGVSRTDKAFAAYVMANAFAALDDQEPGRGHKEAALRWARQAVDLNPARAYTQLVHDLSQP